MKNLLIGLLATASLTFTGCTNTCDDIESAFDALGEKLVPCGGSASDTNFDAEACNAGLDNCSDDDREKLSNYASCLQALPDCEAGQELQYLETLADCNNELVGLSASCSATSVE